MWGIIKRTCLTSTAVEAGHGWVITSHINNSCNYLSMPQLQLISVNKSDPLIVINQLALMTLYAAKRSDRQLCRIETLRVSNAEGMLMRYHLNATPTCLCISWRKPHPAIRLFHSLPLHWGLRSRSKGVENVEQLWLWNSLPKHATQNAWGLAEGNCCGLKITTPPPCREEFLES